MSRIVEHQLKVAQKGLLIGVLKKKAHTKNTVCCKIRDVPFACHYQKLTKHVSYVLNIFFKSKSYTDEHKAVNVYTIQFNLHWHRTENKVCLSAEKKRVSNRNLIQLEKKSTSEVKIPEHCVVLSNHFSLSSLKFQTVFSKQQQQKKPILFFLSWYTIFAK